MYCWFNFNKCVYFFYLINFSTYYISFLMFYFLNHFFLFQLINNVSIFILLIVSCIFIYIIYFWFSVYFNSSCMIIITRLLCLKGQLMVWCELVDKIDCSWHFLFCFWTYDFDSFDFDMIMWNCLRGFTPHVVRRIFVQFVCVLDKIC